MKIRVKYDGPRWMADDYETFEMEVPDDSTDAQIQDLAEAESLNRMSQPRVYWDRLPLKPPHRCVAVRQDRLLDSEGSVVEFCECGRWRRAGTHYWIEKNLLPRVVR